jgi:DNA-binding NarL/FixJ family response regulator
MSLFSVLIVEDQLRFREAFAHALEKAPDIRLVGMATDLQQGRKMFDQTRPDVLLVDLDLPGGSGIELIRHAAHVAPECEVMVISVFGDEQHVLSSIEAGATGYLLKDSPREELLRGARAAARGETVLSPSVAAWLVNRVRTPSRQVLSRRELEVIELVAAGNTNREAAARLFITEATVKSHLLSIYAKLGVSDRAAAVAEAFNQGVLRPRE